ncbi:hypothetical protein BDV95DRAFT_574164 [Massariosphaeria phaeospora]|uniref:Uncharacterized protein n=1 Tax=Massariosphaeria phaeospora TaxID=100035 RepID=A0A7C8I6K7_9PLEO|nr:hypothetical protein BDV95DRAFT_574164 [Massariosphaeria phaeospora]
MIQCDYVSPHMVEFQDHLRSKYAGLPLHPHHNWPLFKSLSSIWYPGFCAPFDVCNALNRWESCMHPIWKERYGHGLEAAMRPSYHRPRRIHPWRLETNGLGSKMSEQMKRNMICFCCAAHPALWGSEVSDTGSEYDAEVSPSLAFIDTDSEGSRIDTRFERSSSIPRYHPRCSSVTSTSTGDGLASESAESPLE